jgi:hypothetical protein
LYSSPNIIRKIKSRRIRWAEYEELMGEEKKSTRFWWESPKEDHSEAQVIDGKMWSDWILGRLAEERGRVAPVGSG